MKNTYTKMIKVLTGLALLGAFSTNALATAILILDDPAVGGGIDVIVGDGLAAGVATPLGVTTHADGSAIPGLVSFNGPVPGSVFDANVSSGASKPLIGPFRTDLLNLNINSSGAGTIDIGFSDIDFAGVLGPVSFANLIGGTTDGLVGVAFGIGDNNLYFSSSSGFGVAGPFGPGAFSGTNTLAGVLGANPFSISQIVNVTHFGPGSITSFDSEVSISEPATLGILGIGLLGIALTGRRRKVA